jgi:hypothetical protein
MAGGHYLVYGRCRGFSLIARKGCIKFKNCFGVTGVRTIFRYNSVTSIRAAEKFLYVSWSRNTFRLRHHRSVLRNACRSSVVRFFPMTFTGELHREHIRSCWRQGLGNGRSLKFAYGNDLKQGRRLRFRSGGDKYGERSEPKKFFSSRGG